jgi:hypothetical protein
VQAGYGVCRAIHNPASAQIRLPRRRREAALRCSVIPTIQEKILTLAMPDLLFDDDPITDALTSQRRKALAAVDAMPVDSLLACPLDDLTQEIMTVYRIPALVIDWDRQTVDTTEVEIELDAGRRAVGTRVTYFIPYSGATGFFHLRPTSHRGEPPSGVVRPDELLLNYTAASVEPSAVLKRLAVVETSVRRWVAWTNGDVETFNGDLADKVGDRLATRLAKAQAEANLPAALGLPRHERPAGPRRDAPLARTRGWAAISSPLPSLGQLPPVGQGHPGRPSWTRALYAEHLEEATKAAGEPHTLAAVAQHFRALDGEIGISPEWLGRLKRRFHFP